ncbi:MAG: hypothetical protein G8D89_16440 [gamma proteobacterium symbiont of Clathrolucina costata]
MADRPTFNWMMKPSSSAGERIVDIITGLGDEFASNLNQVEAGILSVNTGYQLIFSDGHGENQIHPVSCEGAGEVLPEHGHIPILFLATLRKRMEAELSTLAGKFTFCTEEGEAVLLNDWPELKAELERLGVDQETVRADAEAIGFVDPIYQLDKLGADEPALFF